MTTKNLLHRQVHPNFHDPVLRVTEAAVAEAVGRGQHEPGVDQGAAAYLR